MSLKLIELQVALPRTQDAGKLQEQIQQRSQLQHDYASQNVQKEVERKQTTVIREERKDLVRFHQEEQKKKGNDEHQKKRNKKEKKRSGEHHPYKGTFIDYSG